MKLLVLAVLLISTLAATSSAAPADCTPSGTGCSEPSFLANGITLLGTCTASSGTLMASLNTSRTAAQFDAAWNTFCTSACFGSMSAISVDQRCCIDAYGLGPTFYSLLQLCAFSQQSPSRRCGAELGNLGAVACVASNANECNAQTTCEWTNGMCLFKPTQASLDMVCTDCNRAYFTNFPTGGVNPLESFSKIAPVFDFACNKIDNQYCLLSAAGQEYRSAGALTGADLNTYCASSTNTVAKRCFRAMTATTAKSLVHSARVALLTCNASNEVGCQTTFATTLTLAAALEGAAANMCGRNGSTNCFAAGSAALGDTCFGATIFMSSCSANCANLTAAVASGLGCCSPVFSTSGAIIASNAPAGRLLLASIAADSGNVNQTKTYPRAPLSGAALAGYMTNTKGTAATDTFGAVASCSGFTSQYATLVASAGQCTVRPFTRTYVFGLQLSYEGYNACANKDIIKQSLIADIIPKLGITSAQIVSSSVGTHTDGLGLTIRFSAESAEEINSIDATIASVSIPLLTVGREIAYVCPAVLKTGVYTSLVKTRVATTVDGDVAVPTTTTTTTVTTTVAAGPTSPSSTTVNSLVMATFALIIVSLLMF